MQQGMRDLSPCGCESAADVRLYVCMYGGESRREWFTSLGYPDLECMYGLSMGDAAQLRSFVQLYAGLESFLHGPSVCAKIHTCMDGCMDGFMYLVYLVPLFKQRVCIHYLRERRSSAPLRSFMQLYAGLDSVHVYIPSVLHTYRRSRICIYVCTLVYTPYNPLPKNVHPSLVSHIISANNSHLYSTDMIYLQKVSI